MTIMDKYINATHYEIVLQAVLSDPTQAVCTKGIIKALELLNDAEEIVHCKDCRYVRHSNSKNWACIKIPGHAKTTTPGFFCKNAKPKINK